MAIYSGFARSLSTISDQKTIQHHHFIASALLFLHRTGRCAASRGRSAIGHRHTVFPRFLRDPVDRGYVGPLVAAQDCTEF